MRSARHWNPGTSLPSKPRFKRGLMLPTRTTRNGRSPTSGSGCRLAGRTFSMSPDPNDAARVVRGMGFPSRLGVRAATLNPCTPARQDLKSRAVGRAWLPPRASHRRPRNEPSRAARGMLYGGHRGSAADWRTADMGKLDGRRALITGGSGGMGGATAIEFAKEGARAVGLQYAHHRAGAELVAKAAKAEGAESVTFQADVSDRTAAHRMVKAFVERFGGLDALVCYAGFPFRREEWTADFADLTEEAFHGPLHVDLLGSVFTAQAAMPVMKKQRRGAIVLVGSTPAITGDVVGVPYFVAKAGVLALTRALAQILGPYNVHVNAIAPGAVDTEAMAGLKESERKALAKEAALRRRGTPREIARKAVFLCSDDASFMTGETLVVDGGYAMR